MLLGDLGKKGRAGALLDLDVCTRTNVTLGQSAVVGHECATSSSHAVALVHHRSERARYRTSLNDRGRGIVNRLSVLAVVRREGEGRNRAQGGQRGARRRVSTNRTRTR